MFKPATKSQPASSNWLALRKKLPSSRDPIESPRKRRKIDHHTHTSSSNAPSSPRGSSSRNIPGDEEVEFKSDEIRNGESIAQLRKMVMGKLEFTETQQQPGKYLSLDCEMVGVGMEGAESSLARVSLVNYYGAVQLDEFVRQRERVVDYRTQWSGVRETDMIKAKPFVEVQKQVADMLKDRILVGHAVHNDLKALLLAHPRHQTQDTQYHAGKQKLINTKYPALRNLVKHELGIAIQDGEHSSVTDARATMAVYRIHRKEWEKGIRPSPEHVRPKKRKRLSVEDDNVEDVGKSQGPGRGRKGVSSGLSTIVKRGGNSSRSNGGSGPGGESKKWWKELGGRSGGSKGSMRVKVP